MRKIPRLSRDFSTAPHSLTDSLLAEFSPIQDLGPTVADLHRAVGEFRRFPILDILRFFDAVSKAWTSPGNPFLRNYSAFGVTFLVNFLKQHNLQNLLAANLGRPVEFLDQFLPDEMVGKLLKGEPKGIVVHWLAGNVPVLGMISIIQALISKNASIVKLPRENGLILPAMIADLESVSISTDQGELSGKQIGDLVSFVYCDRDDVAGHTQLSHNADVRVAWGGREAVESVMKLEKRYFTDDVIFGPKYSFGVITRNGLTTENSEDIAFRIAMDASVFEQQGCNSPHTIFFEEGGPISAETFAAQIAGGMDRVLARLPKGAVTPKKAMEIASLRASNLFSGARVIQSKGTEWTVVVKSSSTFESACYFRVLYIHKVPAIEPILATIRHEHQTMGMLASPDRKFSLAELAARNGIDRITEFGKMSIHDHPWDGMFPISRFVKWVSLY